MLIKHHVILPLSESPFLANLLRWFQTSGSKLTFTSFQISVSKSFKQISSSVQLPLQQSLWVFWVLQCRYVSPSTAALGLPTLLEVAAYGRPDNVPEGFKLADLYQAWRLPLSQNLRSYQQAFKRLCIVHATHSLSLD